MIGIIQEETSISDLGFGVGDTVKINDRFF